MDDLLKDYAKLLDHTDEHLSFETLSIYNILKDQLSNNEIKFVKKHLDSCSSCMTKLEEIIEEDIEIDPINTKKPKIFQLPVFIKYAAAASIIIAVGIALLFSLQSEDGEIRIAENEIKNNNTVEELVSDSVQVIEKEDKVLGERIKEDLSSENKELYAANIVLENFIERNLRSEGSIKILSPKSNELVGLPIKFEWQVNNQFASVELEIVNNKNVKVFNTALEGNKYTFKDPLTNGLYYWKIKTDGKVSAIGKFIVK